MTRGVNVAVSGPGCSLGSFDYLRLTYDLPWLPERLYISRLALVSREYPNRSWVRSKLSGSQDDDRPGRAILPYLIWSIPQRAEKALMEWRLSVGEWAGGGATAAEVRIIS
jgi:hypothetical protein